jgi:hypothetical protein
MLTNLELDGELGVDYAPRAMYYRQQQAHAQAA